MLCVGCYQCVKIFKAPGKHLCGFLPYLTYAKGAEKPGKSGGFAALDGGDEIGSGLIPHALKLGYLVLLKIIEVSGGADKAVVYKALAYRDAEPLNVHCLA